MRYVALLSSLVQQPVVELSLLFSLYFAVKSTLVRQTFVRNVEETPTCDVSPPAFS